jgi:signal transduction histidine kinase
MLTVFLIIWNTRQFQNNSYLSFIGTAFLFISLLTTLHLLAYKGMGVFTWSQPTDLPTQLWIVSRYLTAFSFLIASFFLKPKFHFNWTLALYTLVTILILLSIFFWRNFPSCYQEGVGLTQFKILSEYVITGIFAISMVLVFLNRKKFDGRVFAFLIASLLFMIATDIAFINYINVMGRTNIIGHLLMALSFFLLYKAIIETGLRQPYSLLFRDLKKSETVLEQRALELSEINTRLVVEHTEKDKVEKELKVYRRQLEQLVEQRTAELSESNRQLEIEIGQRERAEQELRTLSNRTLDMLEEERHFISRELHDETGQSLTVLNLLMGRFKKLAAECKTIDQTDISEAQKIVHEVMQQVRKLSSNLHPGMLEDIGLIPTLNWYLGEFDKRTDIKINFSHSGNEPELSLKTRLTAYRIIQESLTNITRYAGVSSADLRITFPSSEIIIEIEDQGKGFNLNSVGASSTGIRGMRERAMAAGGSLEIHSMPGEGTLIQVTLPVTTN